MQNQEIKIYKSGVHNLLSDEIIPQDAAQASNNWLTQDGRIKLINGRTAVNAEGDTGFISGEIFGYKTNGVKVHYRKAGTKIQYDNGTSWVDVVTGLTASADYAFTNYSSLAGAFTFAFGIDGIFKMNNANPGSYLALYDATKNFKAKAFIDKGRSILWDRVEDKTGIYGSWIDNQRGVSGSTGVYTSVTAEVLGASGNTTYTGNVKAKQGTFTVTVASPAVFSRTAHGLAAGDAVVFSTTGALPTGLTAGTTYYVIAGGLTADAFEVALTPGGTAIITTGTQSGVHTMVSGTRNIFNFAPNGTVAAGLETFKDNYDGTLTGDRGGTGTINYMTGAYSITFSGSVSSGNVVANYQWENSNVRGVTDFTKSATRLAGEGFQFPQDEGGDAILNVLIASDGYYSMKSQSSYRLAISDDDLSATNEVYRKQMGIPSYRAAISTSKGIIFMDNAKPEKPEMTILKPNLAGDLLVPDILFPHFAFSNYVYNDCTIDTYERYVLVACKSENATFNDTILLCNLDANTVDITSYPVRTFASKDGFLFGGGSLTMSVYKIYDGYDDIGNSIDNYWIGKGEAWNSEMLKKHRKLRLKGLISADQAYQVYISYDDSGFQLVGTVLGTGSYVDYGVSTSIGSNMVGAVVVGGSSALTAYAYFVEIRLKKIPKFRKRTIKFVALDIGYVDVEYQMDWDISTFGDRIPSRFRQKQNVSLDGATVDLPNPEF